MGAPLGQAGSDATAPAPGGNNTVKVWDPVVRIFHWTVVAGCVLDLFVVEDGEFAHRAIGYTVAGALAIRLVWGFVGTPHARFKSFVPGFGALKRYVAALSHGREPRTLGHNPAGAVMMLALMALLAGVSATGWMMGLDAYWGVEWVEALHEGFANAILVLALFHAAAALFESYRHRENLVWSMVTGRKRS